MRENLKNLLLIVVLSTFPTLLIWFIFFIKIDTFWQIPLPKGGMATVVSNYDGPLYIAIAKTFYDKALLQNFSFTIPFEYYAAHFPLYPILIRAFSTIFGYLYSSLFVTAISSILAVYFFHKYIKDYVNNNHAVWLTFLFSIFPARWLIVRSVASPEPLFIASVIACVYFFNKKKLILSGIWGATAALTKSPGILLFISLLLTYFYHYYSGFVPGKKVENKTGLSLMQTVPLLLIPASLIAVFYIFQIKFSDFFAYFHSGDNIHLFFPPFQIFNYSAPWVGTFWLEEILFIYLFGSVGLIKLIKDKHWTESWFVGIYFLASIFVSHRDLIRYSLPMVPFLLLAYKDSLIRNEVKFAFAILLIPILLYSLVFISQNTMPISDWGPLL